jgi:hypothetical protein
MMDSVADLIGRSAPGGALVMLIVFAVLAVWRGYLVPKSTVDKMDATVIRVETVQEKRLAESLTREQEWKAAWMASEQARQLQTSQLADLLELARTTDAFIRGLRQVTEGGRTS